MPGHQNLLPHDGLVGRRYVRRRRFRHCPVHEIPGVGKPTAAEVFSRLDRRTGSAGDGLRLRSLPSCVVSLQVSTIGVIWGRYELWSSPSTHAKKVCGRFLSARAGTRKLLLRRNRSPRLFIRLCRGQPSRPGFALKPIPSELKASGARSCAPHRTLGRGGEPLKR
jgi:hypothetical protein